MGAQLSWGQQTIATGQYDGGFENAALNTPNVSAGAAIASYWTFDSASLSNSTIGSDANARTGAKDLYLSTTGASGKYIMTPLLSPALVGGNASVVGSDYIVQYYIKTTAGAVTKGVLQINGTKATPSITLGTADSNGWQKATGKASGAITPAQANTWSGMGTTGTTAFTANIDDFVVYQGSVVDVTVPSDATGATASVVEGSGTSLTLNWTGAQYAGDNGGYVIVRSTSATAVTLNPNGIYAIGNSSLTGGGTVVGITAGVSGTAQSWKDTGLTMDTKYYYSIFAVDKAFNYAATAATCSGTPSFGSTPPTLVADATANTVDNNLDITFTDDATWRAAVSAVKIGTTTLTSGTDYDLTAGNLKLKPSALNLLSIPGSNSVVVTANTYTSAKVTQEILVGAPTAANSTVSISPDLDRNTISTVTCTAKDQYNNLVSGYAFKYNLTRTNLTTSTNESYSFDAVGYTSNITTPVATAVTNSSGVTTFTVGLPTVMNINDGLSFQVKLANGTTNLGTAFSYINVLKTQTITFAALSNKTFATGTYTLTGTASSGLPITYTSSDPTVATISGSTVTFVGIGTTSITASQAGNASWDNANDVTRSLTIYCGSTSIHNNPVTACGSYTWPNNGVTYTSSATVTGSTTNCVTEKLTLTITGSIHTSDVTVCDPYTWSNNGTTYSASGVYYGTTTNCIQERLNLTINAKNTYYADADADGFGAGDPVLLCGATAPDGYATTNTDCDDTNPDVWKTGTFYQDVDGDGYTDISKDLCYGSLTPAGYLAAASTPSKVWDFSDTTTWPLNSTGIGVTDIVNDQLGLYPLQMSTTINYAQIVPSINSFPATATTDAFTSANAFKIGGGGSAVNNMPAQRYMYLDVSGSCRILVWFKTGTGSSTRNLYITDGTTQIGTASSTQSSATPGSELVVAKVMYTGGAKRLYIYTDLACSIYKIEVTGANVTTPSIVAAPTNLAFVPDTTLNDVDHNLDIAFTDNPTWRAAVTGVRIGATTLTAGTDYSISAGHLILKPSGGDPALTLPGIDKKITVYATGYSSSSTGFLQTINIGAASTATSTATISAALKENTTKTITLTAKDQFGNLLVGYVFNYIATITNNEKTTSESYTVNGTAYTANSSNIALAATDANGVATFNVVIPNGIDSGDGISIQAKLTDGTNLGTAFSYAKTATPIVTVVDNCGNSVISTNATGTLLWSTGETTPSITVTTPGTYTVTQTIDGDTSHAGSKVAAPIFNGITTQPVNTPICKIIGGTAVLSVVSVNPNVTYQWQTQAPTGTTWANVTNPAVGIALYTGETTASLSIRKQSLILPLSLTKYRVIVTGTCKTETSNAVTLTDALFPTEIVTAITSASPAAIAGTYAAATLAVGPYVGTTTTVSYRVPTLGAGLTYYWTVPAGVSIVGQAEGVTAVTQDGLNANILNVNFKNISSGIGTIGSITAQAQNVSGCKTAAKAIILTKALPVAPATLVMTDTALPLPASGIAAPVLSFANYMGTTKALTLTAAPSATATSYSWELPAGVTQLTGGNSNVITVDLSGVTKSNTATFTTATGVVTNVLRIGVKAVNGVGSSITPNTALSNPLTDSTAKLLSLTAVAPAAPATLVLTNGTTATPVLIISKFVGTTTEFTLTAAASPLANSYSWEIPTGVNVVSGSDLTSRSIKVNFANVSAGTTSLYIGVKAVNGMGSSVTVNSAATVIPSTTSTAKLLKVTASVPAAPATLVLTNAASVTPAAAVAVVSKFIGTTTELTLTAAASPLANSYSWDIPTGVNVVSGSDLTSNSIKVNFASVSAGTTSLVFGVKAINGLGSSVSVNLAPNASSSAKLLTVTASVPATVAVVTGTIANICKGSTQSYVITASPLANTYTITGPVDSKVTSASNLTNNSNVLTTSDLTFSVKYPAAAPLVKTITIAARNGVGTNLLSKVLALTFSATCREAADKVVSATSATEVYPNPVASDFNIDVTASEAAVIEYAIYSFDGNLVLSAKSVQLNAGVNHISENVAALRKGFYIVRLVNSISNEVITKKLIKE